MKKNLLRGSAAVAAIAIGVSFSATPVFAQDEGQLVDNDVDVIISVGTRRDARSAADTPAPVDVIGSDELLNQGDTDIQNILRTSVPSYNVNTQPISDAATLIRPANLRGLAPDSTLVLVNGKRRHRAAVISFLGGGISDGAQGPDISVIPSIALKQVEVLRDGAASQYGSDAIAGVINFALKDSADGASFEAEWGQTYEGDGDQYSISANIGLPIPLGEGGFLNLSAEYGEIDATNRSVQRDDALALIAAGNSAVGSIANTRGAVNSNDGGATLLVGDLTADGSGACPTIAVTNNVPDPAALAQVAADPDCFVFNELIPGGFTPRFGGDLVDSSFVAGLRGELNYGSGLRYDLSYSYGRNDVTFFINNTINASLGPNTPRDFTPGAYTQTDNNINFDLAYGIENDVFASPVDVAVGFEHRVERFEITQGDDASFALGPLAAPSAAFPTGQGFSSSSNGFGGFTPASAGSNSQSNYALYFDTGVDVTDQLIVQGAIRYEDFYDSFGDTVNYKIGALYKATDNITLRATYSTGFHAPTAGQANVSNVTTAFTGGILQDQGTIPLSSGAGQFIADQLEAGTGFRPTLGPEDSKNLSVGVAFSLADVNFTVDYFRITVDDRIAISDQIDFLDALQTFGAANGTDISTITQTSSALFALDNAGLLNADDFAGSEDLASFGFFTNSFDTRTQGIDVVANTNVELYEGSNTTFNLAFNWTDTTVTDRGLDGPAPLSQGRAAQLEDNLPSTRGNFTVNHFQGPFRALARVNYWGEYFECHLDATNDGAGAAAGFCDLPIFASSEITVDLEAAVKLFDRVELVAGAQNVLDNLPDENPFAGIVGARFPATAPNGYSGGLYYFKIRADF